MKNLRRNLLVHVLPVAVMLFVMAIAMLVLDIKY